MSFFQRFCYYVLIRASSLVNTDVLWRVTEHAVIYRARTSGAGFQPDACLSVWHTWFSHCNSHMWLLWTNSYDVLDIMKELFMILSNNILFISTVDMTDNKNFKVWSVASMTKLQNKSKNMFLMQSRFHNSWDVLWSNINKYLQNIRKLYVI